MLKKIPSIINPELIKVLMEMGHSDEIVLADGNFPAQSLNDKVIRLDGHNVPEVLEAILEFFPLDQYSNDNFVLMEKVPGDKSDVTIWKEYEKLAKSDKSFKELSFEERFAFYERAKKSYAIVATSEKSLYANIILKKGVV